MTTCAMMAGMLPMALALGESGQQNAPLGRAVIGGLAAATLATLFILPSVFALVQRRASTQSTSLDPDDPESVFYGSRGDKPATDRGGIAEDRKALRRTKFIPLSCPFRRNGMNFVLRREECP